MNTYTVIAGGMAFSVDAQFACGRGGIDPALELAGIHLPDSDVDLTHVLSPHVITTIEEFLAERAPQEYAEQRAELNEREEA